MQRGLALIALGAAAIVLAFLLTGSESPAEKAAAVAEQAAAAAHEDDPLTWDPARRAEFEERAATGSSHVIYALSPGGVAASAERTAAWREEIEAAAARHGIAPDRLEALVFLESAGRPEVMAGETPEVASGLTQILPATATDLLAMRVDLPRSIMLTRQIAAALERGKPAKARELARERARIDERFDPAAALDGAGRYLEIAEERLGADDLATVSYHMGIGNLESVIEAYEGEKSDLSYAQLFFDSGPEDNAEAWEILKDLSDDSSLYFWKILASERIMELWRDDPERLKREAELANAKATLEELYHPEDESTVFEEPGDIEAATEAGDLLPLPASTEFGWVADPQIGELASELGEDSGLYAALRPEALAVLSYMASRVKELSDASEPLRVTSAVRDRAYQALLAASNPEATDEYSLHTTGFTFDVLREYEDDLQASALQFVLDRLRALAVIDYAKEPKAIHVTVSPLGAELLAP